MLNIRKLLVFGAALSAAVSCGGEKLPSKADFEAETTSVAIPAEGCGADAPGIYPFTTAVSWTACSVRDVSSWFTFSPERGAAGKSEIKFVAEKNSTAKSRTAVITVYVGTTTKDITFTQAASSSPSLYDDVPSGFAEEAESKDADPAGTADLSVFNGMGHPRLLMNRADFDRLKDKVVNNPGGNRNLTLLHELMIAAADESAASTTAIKYNTSNTDKNQDQAKLAMKRIGSCAYAYRMTGQEKYLNRAVKDMETVAGFSTWDASTNFLTTAQMAAAVALGYDWLYYALDYDLRVKVRKVLLDYVVIPAHTAWFTTAEHNWNQVCYGGSVMAAIAIYGKEKTESGTLINECITRNGPIVSKIYDPDGVYPEGYAYWGFGTGFQTFIFASLEKVFGTLYGMDSSVGLAKTPQWMLMSSGVGGRVYCFGDSTGNYDQPKMGMWWFAKSQKNPSLLRNELRLLTDASSVNPYSTTMSEVRMLPVVLACANDIDGLDSVTDDSGDKQTMYCGKGDVPVALFRTQWDNTDSDRYLGVKGGKANHSHGHMDAGSFVYDALGCRWSEDLNRPDYTSITNALSEAGGNYWALDQNSYRWKVWCLNNLGHSTLTINGADHRVDGAATIVETYDTEASRGVKLLMTPVFDGQAASVLRTVEIRNGADLYVTDEITALSSKSAAVQWRMITSASVSVGSDMETLTQSDKQMYLKVKTSDGAVTPALTSWEAKGTNPWDAVKDYSSRTVAGYTVTVPAGATVTFVTVLTSDKDLKL